MVYQINITLFCAIVNLGGNGNRRIWRNSIKAGFQQDTILEVCYLINRVIIKQSYVAAAIVSLIIEFVICNGNNTVNNYRFG